MERQDTGLASRLLDSSTAEFTEQSENVYENKGALQKSTTPGPSLSKEGNFPGTPPQMRRGRGWWDFAAFAHFAPWRETGIVMRKNDGTKRECL
jgi:hypothetical protein